MKKRYLLLLLLCWSAAAFAQNQSPLLKKIFTLPDSSSVIDYRYKNVFTYRQNGTAYTYYLSNINTGSTTIIPYTKQLQQTGGIYTDPIVKNLGWITRFGLLFAGPSLANDTLMVLYEWKNGVLGTIAENMTNVNISGDYVTWLKADPVNNDHHILWRRNLATGQQIQVADTVINEAYPGPNGNVAYTDGRSLSFCQDSSCSVVANVDSLNEFYRGANIRNPRTDGEKILYEIYITDDTNIWSAFVNVFENGSSKALYEHNFGDYQTGGYAWRLKPLINKGYIAGQQLLTSVYYHFRTNIISRDPQGVQRILQETYTQMPPWGLASVDVLTPSGDVGGLTSGAISRNSQIQYYYYLKGDGTKKRFLSETGRGIYYEELDSTWLIADDFSLYRANIDTVYDHHVIPFTKQAYARNRTRFTAGDFITHYTGPDTGRGQIQRIQFLSFPKNGILLGKNNVLIQQTQNAVVPRAELDSIKYSAGSFPGTDTIRWRAYDGLDWTKDTFLYIKTVPPPDTVKPFERTTLAGTPIRFWSSNFKLNYTGKLAGIRVSRLPAYGKLTIGGKQLFYERSRDVTLAELDSMYYTPNPNIIGIDTLQWMGFNGTEYTKNDTPAILRIYPILSTPPILRTLESTYSTSAGADTILIANYPAPRWHTDVTVVADNNRVLPVAPDNTFTIDPSTYSVGAHTLKVLFKHKLDSISIQRSFTITSPFAPMMMAAEKYEVTQEGGPVSAWPNPFRQQFTLTGLSVPGTYILTLVNQQGQTILQQRIVNQNRVVLNLDENAGTGVYLLKILNENKKDDVKTLKLLHL